MNEGKRITYTVDDIVYDVNKFSDDGKFYFQTIIELNAEIGALNKKADVLKAAALTFNARIRNELEDNIEVEEVVDESVESGVL